jgi:hypothetical protein
MWGGPSACGSLPGRLAWLRLPTFCHGLLTLFVLLTFTCAPAFAGDGADPPQPLTVCEVLAHQDTYSGKPVLLVGRFSFREYGRFLSEKGCVLHVMLDAKNGPVPPAGFSVDTDATNRKLAAVRKTTALENFRFGSTDYDRWAMIYGRVEAGPPPAKHGSREFDDVSVQVLCHSLTLLIFLHEQ